MPIKEFTGELDKPLELKPFTGTLDNPEDQAKIARGFVGGAKDIGASFVSGVGNLMQLPGQISELVGFTRTGDLPEQKKTGLQALGADIQKLGEEAKSPTLIAKEQLRAREIEKAEGFFQEAGAALRTTATDPALLTSFFAEQIPNLIGTYGFGILGKGGAKLLMKEATEQAMAKVGVGSAVSGGAVMQGTDVGYDTYQTIYKQLREQGVPDEEAQGIALSKGRVAAIEAAGLSLASSKLPGGTAIERALVGKGMPGTAGFLKSTVGEIGSEAIEEGGGAFAKQVGIKEVFPETDLLKGVGAATALGGLGGALFGGPAGVVNALRARQETPPPIVPPVEPPAPTAGVIPPEEPPAAPPVETLPPETPPVVPPVEPPKEPPKDALQNYFTGLPEGSEIVFQNRDRSTQASILQMQNIAANPDYSRVSESKEFGTGAPVTISTFDLPNNHLGKTDTATLPDGTKVPIMYAVVPAAMVHSSNLADGTIDPMFMDMQQDGLRAIAGNGRIAGLKAAYTRGTAEDYKNQLIADKNHGVNPEVIKLMPNPVLVRIMPQSYVTPNIADLSNRPTIARLSPVETAKNDIRRFDLGGLEFNEDGTPSGKTLMQFINAMPIEERTELTDKSGRPTTQAIDRLANAIFQKAYGSDSLIDLYAQAADPEAKTILNALARVAPKMAQLEGAGEYDVRNAIIQAAELAVNARRTGMNLKTAAQQIGLDVDPNSALVLDMFADNVRSGKRIGERLGALADEAIKQTQAGTDMFGEVPKRPLSEIYGVLKAPVEEPGLFGETTEEPPKPSERKEFTIDKTPLEIQNELKGKTIAYLSQWLIDNAPNSFAKEIAQKIKNRVDEYQKIGVPIGFKVFTGSARRKSYMGVLKTKNIGGGKIGYEINLNGPGPNGVPDGITGTDYETALHEMLHLATSMQIKSSLQSPEGKELTELLKFIRKKVTEDYNNNVDHPLLNTLKSRIKAKNWNAGINILKNERELLAWGLSNSEFQDYLSKLKYSDNKSAYDKFVELVRKLLNIDKEYETAMERLVSVSGKLMDVPIDELAKQIKVRGWTLGKEPSSTKKIIEKLEEEEGRSTKELALSKAKEMLQKRKPIPMGAFADVDPNLVQLAQPVFYPQQKTIIDRIEGLRDNFWKKTAQGIADQFRAIKDYSEEGYMQARLSKTVDGALEGLTFFGQVFNDSGALNIKQGTKGLMDIMKPIGQEVDRYQMWVALNRESQLPIEKRTKMPNMGELIKRRNEFADGTIDGKPRLEIYNKIRSEMNTLNKSVLKVALDAGLIDSSRQKIDDLNARDFLTTKDKEILTRPYREEIERIENKKTMNVTEEDKNILKDYRALVRDINSLNNMTPDLRQELIDYYTNNPGAYERFSADINYIPFYRAMEDGDLQGASTASGLTNQQFSKELTGGERPYGDLMENTLRNWSHILSASMKNQAVNTIMKDATDSGAVMPNLKLQYEFIDGNVVNRSTGEIIGDGSVKPYMTTADKGTVKMMNDGQPIYYRVIDPMLLDSISSIGYMGPKSKFLDVARDFKNMLQFGVTISPAFKVRNLFRDSISAIAVTDLKKNPFANVIEGWVASNRNNPAHISALAGGAIFNFGTAYEGDQSKLIKRLLDQGVDANTILDSPDKVKKGLTILWEKYKDWGNKSESANRMALYNQLKDKGYDHLQASFYARDLLDFSMQGSWPAFRLAAQTIPFLNARVQGLYKLGRDGITPTSRVLYNTITGKEIEANDAQKARAFGYTTLAVAMASMLLYMAFKDDEEFQKREAWDRDNFWWFRLPGMEAAFRVPKPFEIGAFGTMAERVLEQIIDQGAEGKAFGDSVFRMLTDTFAINPIPQMIRPLVDLYANKDAFTGAPIESAGMERLSKQERVTDNTSPIAQALGGLSSIFGEKVSLSPVQVDYAIKAYFGWLGGTATQASVYATLPFRDGAYPDIKLMDKVSQGFIKSLPSDQSRYVTTFYENNKEINQAYADMRHYAELGDTEKVQKILEDKGDKIVLNKMYDKTAKEMANVRAQIRVITNDKTLDGTTKREMIDNMKQILSMLAEQAESVRKSLKANK